MSVFNSSRPVSAEEKLEALRQLELARKNNRTTMESTAIKQNDIALESFHTQKEIEAKYKETVNENKLAEVSIKSNIARRNNALFMLENRLLEEGKEQVFNSVLFEAAHKALWIDDQVKNSPDTISSMFQTFTSIKESIDNIIPKNNDTPMITCVREAVLEVVKDSVNRIVTEAKKSKEDLSTNEIESIKFNISEEEDNKLNDNLSDLGMDDIVTMVKNKTLSVVQDEQKAGKERADLFKEMDDALTPEEDETAENSDGESVPSSESVSVLREGRLRNIKNRINRSNYGSIFESIMMYNMKDIKEKAIQESIEASNEATYNATLMNSIFHYTVLETFNTLKLYDMKNPTSAIKIVNMYKNM